MVLWRPITYVRADDEGNFDPHPLARRRFIFYGRSVFQLTGVLSILLREWYFGIRLCVRAGSQGRLTPLVIDLPANEQPMDIVVLTAGSPGRNQETRSLAAVLRSRKQQQHHQLRPPETELLPDGMHVRLLKRIHGVYLHADEDGARVSLRLHRASLNTAWHVHRVRRAGDDYMLLQSAAYGRYLALSPQPVSLAYAGHAAILVANDASEQDDVLWETVTTTRSPGESLAVLSVTICLSFHEKCSVHHTNENRLDTLD
ncbi:hypothetical protein HU200_035685 [Digitaria exilis]|uniref:DUF569 domain-containing protein n=1 Tax=Digitaria exilis TaxID=1010633 RepID=A0A835BHU0_9POAL|nr:hypothetical protein HU200_035685 [Digitaria exilis]